MDVIVAGRTYPLKIDKDKEDQVKQVIADLNKNLNDFQMKYGRDLQDCLAMNLISMAFELDELKSDAVEDSNLNEKLNSIEEALSNLL